MKRLYWIKQMVSLGLLSPLLRQTIKVWSFQTFWNSQFQNLKLSFSTREFFGSSAYITNTFIFLSHSTVYDKKTSFLLILKICVFKLICYLYSTCFVKQERSLLGCIQNISFLKNLVILLLFFCVCNDFSVVLLASPFI